MQELIQDSIKADSVVVDTLKAVVELPVRNSNLVENISHIFGESVSKGDCIFEASNQVGRHMFSWFDTVVLFLVICLYIIILKRYSSEMQSIAKIVFFPTLFNRTHEINNVHLKHYLAYGFIFSIGIISLLSWLYVADGDFKIPIAVYMYFVFKLGISNILALKKGKKSQVYRFTYFMVSFCATSLCVLTPIAVISMIFGTNRFLYILIIIVLSSFYFFIGRYFHKEKLSFKQLLLYLCVAEVVPLALVSCLFYTKIITFGN